MFNKKYKNRIEELEVIIEKRDNTIERQVSEISKLRHENRIIENDNIKLAHMCEEKNEKIKDLEVKIRELETCFKPLETNCEEVVKKPKKTPKKTSKTAKKE